MTMTHYRSLIAGEWVAGGTPHPNQNPSDTDTPCGIVEHADAAQADAAVRAAAAALPSWAATPLMQRQQALLAIAAGLRERAPELARVLSSEQGKTLQEANGEVQRAADIFQFYAGEVLRQPGEWHPSLRDGCEVEITHEPLGVVLLITPWNFPLAIPAWKTAPALAFGNTVVLKPSEFTPASACLLAQVIQQAGIPDGVFNLVLGDGRDIGPALLSHPDVAGVSFTGSSASGKHIAAQAIAGNKALQMEMGGKNALIILDDAELDVAVHCAIDGAYFSTGQRCTASSRLIATPGIHDRLLEALRTRIDSLRIGHALAPDTQIGPVANQAQFEKNLSYIALARRESHNVSGGHVLERPTQGYFLSPCLIADVDNNARVSREEIFGPVACLLKADNYDHALQIANDTPYGLSSGICTTSLKHATHFRRHTQSGLAIVNMPTSGVDFHVPFGGRKASSHGASEQGRHARDFFTQLKTAYIRSGTP